MTDLRTATPWTLVWTAVMTDCAATPTTFVEWDTAILSSTSYTALPVTPSFDQSSATIYVPFTYPDLTMTRFKPGDELTLVAPRILASSGLC
jgi:hypothetical protein